MSGIITEFDQSLRCNRCDRLMSSSEHRNQKVAYQNKQRPNPICIKCALYSKTKQWVSLQEVDDYVNKLLGVKHGN